MTRIETYGWRGAVEPGLARVVSAHGDYYRLVCNEAEVEILARRKKAAFTRMKSVRPDDMKGAKRSETVAEGPLQPITGDFVRFRYNVRGDSMILEVLPRFSHFERKDPTARRTSQTLAVNFDTLFIMMSLNEDFSLPRLKRYLDLASDMGEAEAVVVLTKSDLLSAPRIERPEVELAARYGAKTLEISSHTGAGLDAVKTYARAGRTVAFIGSSGVGKSTLLNTLAGEERAAVQEIQAWSGKGRHTTTCRELVRLPSGALVVDTPGIREIGRLDEEELLHAKGLSTHRWRK